MVRGDRQVGEASFLWVHRSRFHRFCRIHYGAITVFDLLEKRRLGRGNRTGKAEDLSALYGQLIYEGLWFSDIRRALDEFYRKANEVVTGEVRMRLYKGSVVVEGRRSPESLYDLKLASYGEEDAFDHQASTGFVKIWSLPRMVEAIRARRSKGN